MTDAWYAACLAEAEAFLDKFQGQSKQVVSIDSDLVAALIGLLQGAAIQQVAFRHIASAGMELERLG